MQEEYHILSLSGGKDSTALAFFIRDNMPEIFDKLELVFSDTECEIPETYDYLNKIEVFLDKKIIRIKPERSFEHIHQTRKMIPSVNNRWCTVELKIKPFQKFLKENYFNKSVHLYIGIRADEANRAIGREKYKNNQLLISEHFPFVEHNLIRKDIDDILNNVGIGYSNYYNWRKRSGCYFCMYQSKNDWLNLYKNHPDLYQKAMNLEFKKTTYGKQKRFGWLMDISLEDLIKPENMCLVENNYKKICLKKKKQVIENKLMNIY